MRMDIGFVVIAAIAVVIVMKIVFMIARQRLTQSARNDAVNQTARVAASTEVVSQAAADKPKVLAAQQWSGAGHGPMPIQHLTRAQWACLYDAGRAGASLAAGADGDYRSVIEREDQRGAHQKRIVDALVRHGFLAPDETSGHITITDKGLQAFEQLPMR